MAPAGFALLTSVCLGIQAVIVVLQFYQMGLEQTLWLDVVWPAGAFGSRQTQNTQQLSILM